MTLLLSLVGCHSSSIDDTASSCSDADLFASENRVHSLWPNGCGLREDGSLFCAYDSGIATAVPGYETGWTMLYGSTNNDSHTFVLGERGAELVSIRLSDNPVPELEYGFSISSEGLIRVRGASAGSCILDVSGDIRCWDYEDWAWSTDASLSPAAEYSGDYIDFVEALGARYALTSGGSIELIDVLVEPRRAGNEVTAVEGSYVEVEGAFGILCGLKSDGSVDCFGSACTEYPGSCEPPSADFVNIEIIAPWMAMCGLTRDGSIECWGEECDYSMPPAGTDYLELVVGNEAACAVGAAGAICWGRDLSDPFSRY
jgi:hypothetical protein